MELFAVPAIVPQVGHGTYSKGEIPMKLLFASVAAAALIAAAPSAFADPPDQHGKPGQHGGSSHTGSGHNNSSNNSGNNGNGPSHMGGSPQSGGGTKTWTDSKGMTKTTASPATTMNQMSNKNDHHGDHGKNNWSGNNNGNWSNNNHGHGNNWSNGHRNSHANFNRRNVTAQHHYRYRGNAWRWPNGYRYQRWTFGMTLPSVFWAQNYWINDYDDYGLGVPPPGTVWVRYNDDAILIDQYTGEILEVVYGQFD